MNKYPRVGVGVLIFNENKQILLGKRISDHGINCYGPRGRHLEFGESFKECAIREVYEETGLILDKPEYLATTNDMFLTEQKHYVSIFMKAYVSISQEIIVKEPDKISSWQWFNTNDLPKNLFLPLENFLKINKII